MGFGGVGATRSGISTGVTIAGQPNNRTTKQGKIELLSQWTMEGWDEQFYFDWEKNLSLSVELVEKCCWMPEELDLQSYDLCSPQKGAQSHKLPAGRRIFSILDGKGWQFGRRWIYTGNTIFSCRRWKRLKWHCAYRPHWSRVISRTAEVQNPTQ